jgi:dTDP-4-dehydrorhamnose reductase
MLAIYKNYIISRKTRFFYQHHNLRIQSADENPSHRCNRICRRCAHASLGCHRTRAQPTKLNQLEDDGIRTVRADISKKDEVTASFSDVELVFHCAALPSPWGGFEKFYQANVIGARNIVQTCLENNVKRLVYISTPSIYFDYNSRIGVKENDSLPEPISHYAATKRLAEEEIEKGFVQGLSVVSQKSANGLVIRLLGMQDYASPPIYQHAYLTTSSQFFAECTYFDHRAYNSACYALGG